MKKLVKNWHMHDRLQLLATILARWRRLVASNKALNLPYWAMRVVLYRRTAAAIKRASLFGTLIRRCFVCCCPGGRWGNTEWVVAQLWCPVASRVALDMPHWVVLSVLLRHTASAIKMANDRGAFVPHCCLFCMIIHSNKTMLWSIKLTTSCNINLIGLISLFIWYWLLPVTMDAISATIVAGGWAQFKNTQRLV